MKARRQTANSKVYKQQGNSTQNQANENFYGTWLIKRTIAFGRVYALSDEEIRNILGETIEFSPEKASFQNKICKNPIYKRSILSETDFFTHNGYTSFKEIGFQGKNIVKVEVFNEKEDYRNLWYSIGRKFFIKDENTLITNYEGVFFELVKYNK